MRSFHLPKRDLARAQSERSDSLRFRPRHEPFKVRFNTGSSFRRHDLLTIETLIGTENRVPADLDELHRSTTQWAHTRLQHCMSLAVAVNIVTTIIHSGSLGKKAAVHTNIVDCCNTDTWFMDIWLMHEAVCAGPMPPSNPSSHPIASPNTLAVQFSLRPAVTYT